MNKEQKKRLKQASGLAAGLGLAAICPPAAAIAGGIAFLRGARKYAQSGDPNDARDMVLGYSDISNSSGKG